MIEDASLPAAPGTAIAWLPDGNQALTAGLDFQLRLWDILEGRFLKSWDARGPISAIRVISPGQRALLGAVQGVVSWDIQDWKQWDPVNLWSHAEITSLCWVESRSTLLAGSEDTTIHRWKLPGGEKLPSLPDHPYPVTSLAGDRSGRLVLSGDQLGQLFLWDLENSRCAQRWQAHAGSITALDVSAAGKLAITCGQDGRLKLWDLEGTPKELAGHEPGTTLHDLAFVDDGSWAATAGDDGAALWDLKQGRIQAQTDPVPVRKISLSPRKDCLAGLVRSNRILVWPLHA